MNRVEDGVLIFIARARVRAREGVALCTGRQYVPLRFRLTKLRTQFCVLRDADQDNADNTLFTGIPKGRYTIISDYLICAQVEDVSGDCPSSFAQIREIKGT
jgi:hypothetical protein